MRKSSIVSQNLQSRLLLVGREETQHSEPTSNSNQSAGLILPETQGLITLPAKLQF